MNAENFIKFCKCWEIHRNSDDVTSKYNVSPKTAEEEVEFDNYFNEEIDMALPHAKVFEINDDYKKLLMLTDSPINNDEINLPFKTMFLDIRFLEEELKELDVELKEKIEEVVGVLVTERYIVDKELKGMIDDNLMIEKSKFDELQEKIIRENILGKALKFTIMFKTDTGDEKTSEWVWDSFTRNISEYTDKKIDARVCSTSNVGLQDFIHRFTLNFLNFLNNPEVEYVEHVRRVENKQRRLKAGKPIIPSTFTINVSGKLKVYIDDMINKSSWTYGYRFWVRGHFRQLISDKYSIKKRIWILPFIKGKGVLIEKVYKLK